MVAAKKANMGIVRKLIHHGASKNLTNKVNPASFQIVLEFGRKTANNSKS